MRALRVTYLVETLSELWGGVKTVCLQANRLAAMGHHARILSRTPAPAWMEMRCEVLQVPSFAPDLVPPSDVVVGTFWTTVPHAVAAAGPAGAAAVHFCQGYEGANPEGAKVRHLIEDVYRIPRAEKVVISPHLREIVRALWGRAPRMVTYPIDHEVFHPPAVPRRRTSPLRVGVVGPSAIAWKDVATGCRAADLAFRAGLDLVLVRVSPVPFDAREPAVGCPVERHVRVPPSAMGDMVRSLDVFLGTSRGAEEGFFLPSLEALACGVPCVLTDIPCHRSYAVPGRHALYVPPADPAAMAAALERLAADAGLREGLQAAGPAAAAPHTWDRHMEDWLSCLEGILGSRGILPGSGPARRPAPVVSRGW